jgi:hypothetical protein
MRYGDVVLTVIAVLLAVIAGELFLIYDNRPTVLADFQGTSGRDHEKAIKQQLMVRGSVDTN